MSRVHEALARAAEGPNARSARSTISTHEGAFQSAWPSITDEPLSTRGPNAGSSAQSTTSTDEGVFQSAWPSVNDEAVSTTSPKAGSTELLMVSRPAISVKGFSSEWRERLASAPEGNPALIEQFRRLAGTLHNAQTASEIRLLMVTSATPDDGKTLTAVNLALVLSESYRRRVLLVDADLRRPSIPHVVDLSQGVGLSENLRAGTEQKLALVQLSPTLTLLPAGQPIPDPIGALTSSRMRHILAEAAARFDWVILDAPPVGQSADASLLTEMVHGTLFVIRAGQTQHPHVVKALEVIGRQRILGVVLNGVEEMPHQPYYERDSTEGNGGRQARKSGLP